MGRDGFGLPSRPTKNDGYHVACYQNFTAVTSVKISSENAKPDASGENVPLVCTVSNTNNDNRPRSSAVPAVSCLFCNLIRKKRKDGSFELVSEDMELPSLHIATLKTKTT